MVTKHRSERHQALRAKFPPDGRHAKKAAWKRAMQWIRNNIMRTKNAG